MSGWQEQAAEQPPFFSVKEKQQTHVHHSPSTSYFAFVNTGPFVATESNVAEDSKANSFQQKVIVSTLIVSGNGVEDFAYEVDYISPKGVFGEMEENHF